MASPVPFKTLEQENSEQCNDSASQLRQELEGFISTLPWRPFGTRRRVRSYEGAWWNEAVLPGIVALRRRFAPRPDDVLLASYPKSGTTWLKALTFAVMTRSHHPLSDHPLLRLNPHDCVPLIDELFGDGRSSTLEDMPSPRILNTHMPYSALPESVTGAATACKIIYICRDPKDTVVSIWHFINNSEPDDDKKMPFADLLAAVYDGAVPSGPIWDNVLGYWRANVARPGKVLFLKYEEMLRDTAAHVERLAEFVGRPFSEEEKNAGAVEAVVELCSFERLKGLEVNKTGTQGSFFKFSNASYFRKGVAEDWRNHMTEETAAQFDGFFREKFEGSGLTIL